jgi:sec-independent protein translocase protein TatA
VIGLDNPIHIMFLLVILLLVFGAKRLPELGHSLGSGMRGFKDAISGTQTQAVVAPPTEQRQPAEQERAAA